MNPIVVAQIVTHYILPAVLGLYLFYKIGMPIMRLIGLFIGLIMKILNMLMVIILGLLEKLARFVHRDNRKDDKEEELTNYQIIE